MGSSMLLGEREERGDGAGCKRARRARWAGRNPSGGFWSERITEHTRLERRPISHEGSSHTPASAAPPVDRWRDSAVHRRRRWVPRGPWALARVELWISIWISRLCTPVPFAPVGLLPCLPAGLTISHAVLTATRHDSNDRPEGNMYTNLNLTIFSSRLGLVLARSDHGTAHVEVSSLLLLVHLTARFARSDTTTIHSPSKRYNPW